MIELVKINLFFHYLQYNLLDFAYIWDYFLIVFLFIWIDDLSWRSDTYNRLIAIVTDLNLFWEILVAFCMQAAAFVNAHSMHDIGAVPYFSIGGISFSAN